MNLGVFSIIIIFVAIAIGFWKNINTGLVSLAFALILGQFVGGLEPKYIINMWPTNLFFMLVGVTLLFSIARANGTLELLAKKCVRLSGGRKALIPVIVYFLALVLAAIGPGNISIAALMAPIVMAIARETKISPVFMGEILVIGAIAGGISPIAPTGIIGINLSQQIGLDTGINSWINQIVSSTIFAIVVYIVSGGLKLRGKRTEIGEIEQFNLKQKITLAGIAALVISVIGFKLNVGLAGFFISAILLLLKVADEKQAIAGIPWSTIMLIGGTGVLISIAAELGGIEVLSNALAKLMTPRTASAILVLTAGVMSFFSSASGVVMPTLIPTVPGLVENLGGAVSPEALVAAIIIGAHMVTPSPISTMGALAYAGATEDMDKQELFKGLLIWAIVGTVFTAVLALVGIVGKLY